MVCSMRNLYSLVPGLVCALGASEALGIVIRHDVPDADYRALAAQPQFSATGRFSAGGLSCSSVLIAPDWVLTAAHCVVFGGGQGSFLLNGRSYSVAQAVPHPGFNPFGDPFGGNDIALLQLASSVTDAAPARVYRGGSEQGATGTVVGFGAFGTGITGAMAPDGNIRAAQNIIDFVGGTGNRIVGFDFDDPTNPSLSSMGSPMPLPLEGSGAPGDSGGPLFMQEGGSWFVAGVVSFGSQQLPRYGDESYFTRVSSYTTWIDQYVPVPAPSSAVLCGMGALLAAGRRRR